MSPDGQCSRWAMLVQLQPLPGSGRHSGGSRLVMPRKRLPILTNRCTSLKAAMMWVVKTRQMHLLSQQRLFSNTC
jgi:hypothetical protein